jgi:hypothetical protein
MNQKQCENVRGCSPGGHCNPPVIVKTAHAKTTKPRLTCSTWPVAETLARVVPPSSTVVGLDGVDVSVSSLSAIACGFFFIISILRY